MIASVSNKYEIVKEIGRGHFGTVEIIKRVADGRMLVWKKVKYGTMNSQQKQQVISEVNILKDMNHSNIVRYYDRIVDKQNTTVHIVMEYCPGGDLNHRLQEIKEKKEYLDESVIWKIFYQLVSSLHYCHNRQRKILHRDIKPANIFIDYTGENIKLGDFGLSKQLGEYSQYASTYVGTPYYMSPEQTLNEKYNEKSDIWSVGCIIYEIAALKRPFSGQNVFDLASKIRSGKFERIPLIYSQNLSNAIKWMLRVNPQMRPTTSELLSLPIMKSRSDDKQIKQKFENLRRKQGHLKQKEQKLYQRIKQLREMKQGMHKSKIYIPQIHRSKSSKEQLQSPQKHEIRNSSNNKTNSSRALKKSSIINLSRELSNRY